MLLSSISQILISKDLSNLLQKEKYTNDVWTEVMNSMLSVWFRIPRFSFSLVPCSIIFCILRLFFLLRHIPRFAFSLLPCSVIFRDLFLICFRVPSYSAICLWFPSVFRNIPRFVTIFVPCSAMFRDFLLCSFLVPQYSTEQKKLGILGTKISKFEFRLVPWAQNRIPFPWNSSTELGRNADNAEQNQTVQPLPLCGNTETFAKTVSRPLQD